MDEALAEKAIGAIQEYFHSTYGRPIKEKLDSLLDRVTLLHQRVLLLEGRPRLDTQALNEVGVNLRTRIEALEEMGKKTPGVEALNHVSRLKNDLNAANILLEGCRLREQALVNSKEHWRQRALVAEYNLAQAIKVEISPKDIKPPTMGRIRGEDHALECPFVRNPMNSCTCRPKANKNSTEEIGR